MPFLVLLSLLLLCVRRRRRGRSSSHAHSRVTNSTESGRPQLRMLPISPFRNTSILKRPIVGSKRSRIWAEHDTDVESQSAVSDDELSIPHDQPRDPTSTIHHRDPSNRDLESLPSYRTRRNTLLGPITPPELPPLPRPEGEGVHGEKASESPVSVNPAEILYRRRIEELEQEVTSWRVIAQPPAYT